MRVHKYIDSAWSIYDFLTPRECLEHIERSEGIGYEEATIDDGLNHHIAKNIRNNARIIFDDLGLADTLWALLQEHLPQDLDGWSPSRLNERFRFYKYDKFQTFKWHRDLPYRPNEKEMSKLTFMVYLNDEFEGGFTEFDEFNIWPEKGMAVLFNHKLRHAGSIVTSGTKYVLRTDVIYKLV